MLPVVDQQGNRRTEAITIFLHVREDGHVKGVCSVVPRVRDAVLQVLIADPLHIIGNRIHVNGMRQMVVEQVNYSLGKNTITGFKIYRGAKSFGKGTSSKLPGVKLGCMRVGTGVTKLETKKTH